MPTYPVKHKETGETKELSMSMMAYDEWRKENPDWDKDWSAGVAGVGEVGETYDKLKKSHPGWNDVLQKVSQVPGSKVNPV
jgi:broad specificity phosphatase PhoE